MALLFSAVTATSDSHQAEFLVSGIPTCMEDLEDWTALFKPVAAPAFDNRKICYFWNSEIGFIELVNR